MASGFEVYNGAGQLILSDSDRISKYISAVWTGGGDGAVYVPQWATAAPWWYLATNGYTVPGSVLPYVSRSGDNLVWGFSGTPAALRRGCTIVYGAY